MSRPSRVPGPPSAAVTPQGLALHGPPLEQSFLHPPGKANGGRAALERSKRPRQAPLGPSPYLQHLLLDHLPNPAWEGWPANHRPSERQLLPGFPGPQEQTQHAFVALEQWVSISPLPYEL